MWQPLRIAFRHVVECWARRSEDACWLAIMQSIFRLAARRPPVGTGNPAAAGAPHSSDTAERFGSPGRLARLAACATVVLLALGVTPRPAAADPCMGDSAPAGAFWSACLTAGTSGNQTGYIRSATVTGALSDDTVGSLFSVWKIAHNSSTQFLVLQFGAGSNLGPPSLAGDWTLHVGSNTHAFGTGVYVQQGSSWGWSLASTPFTDGDDITVALTTAAAPTVRTPIPDQWAPVDAPFSYQFPRDTFDYVDTGLLEYTATKPDGTALPTWLTFTDSTRTFAGTPTAGDVGRLSVKVTATHGGNSGDDTFDIQVTAQETPHPVLSETRMDVEVGDRVEYTVSLSWQPSEETAVEIRRIEHDENRLSTHNPVSYKPQRLTFTSSNWHTPQTVSLRITTPLEDGTSRILESAQVRLNHTIFRGESGVPDAALDIHITKRFECPANMPGNAFWRSCLTVGAGRGGLLGYTAGSTGELSRNQVTYNGTSYVVDGLYTQNGNWHISFNKTPSVENFEWDLVHVVSEETARTLNRVTRRSPVYGPPEGSYDSSTHTYIMEGTQTEWVDGAKISVALAPGPGRPEPEPEPETDPPAAPTNLTATAGDGSVALAWTPPADTADITSWQVRYGERDGTVTDWGAWSNIPGSSKTTTSYTVTGLRSLVHHGFQVRAMAGTTAGASSNTVAIAPTPAQPLTASFENVPPSHNGASMFTFELRFSENVEGLSYRTLRSALEAEGGDVRNARRISRDTVDRNRRWEIEVEPESYGPVTITLPRSAFETPNGRQLSNVPTATVAGPVGISVADAQVDEGAGTVLSFAVALSRAADSSIRVDYETQDGSAQAGADYTATSGTLRIRAGRSSATIEVPVLDDDIDEGEETLTLVLSNPSEGRLTDDEATGTIVNSDPLPKAMIARFGRTAAVHVVEHVEERIAAPREPGFRGRFAGRELRRGMEREMALGFLSQLGGGAGAHPGAAGGGAGPLGTPGLGTPGPGDGLGMASPAGPMNMNRSPAAMGGINGAAAVMGAAAGPRGEPLGGGLLSMGLGHDPLTGSSFALNRETKRGGVLSFWSRAARSYFAGQEGTLSLGGDVRTTMFGADYAKGPLVAGLSLGHSRGLGEYAGKAGGRVASAVTGLYPWLGYKATDRITVWGVAGYGSGGMLLTPENGPALDAGLSMAMAAAGTRGELVAGTGGFDLAFKADALWVGTATDGVDGPAGRLAATAAAVSRFRTGLEGSRDYALGGRLSLRPMVEVGFRQDGGDAETGAGMDVGGGVVVADGPTGLAVDVRVRTLVVHQAEGFRERGVAVSFSYNPTPSTPLGFTARVAPSWGGQAMGGAEALWGRETMAGMAHGGLAQGNRLDGEVGYGLPVGSRFVGTPRVGFSASEHGRDYRVGYGLGALDTQSLRFEFGVDAQRRESPMLGGADNGVLGRASLGW